MKANEPTKTAYFLILVFARMENEKHASTYHIRLKYYWDEESRESKKNRIEDELIDDGYAIIGTFTSQWDIPLRLIENDHIVKGSDFHSVVKILPHQERVRAFKEMILLSLKEGDSAKEIREEDIRRPYEVSGVGDGNHWYMCYRNYCDDDEDIYAITKNVIDLNSIHHSSYLIDIGPDHPSFDFNEEDRVCMNEYHKMQMRRQSELFYLTVFPKTKFVGKFTTGSVEKNDHCIHEFFRTRYDLNSDKAFAILLRECQENSPYCGEDNYQNIICGDVAQFASLSDIMEEYPGVFTENGEMRCDKK